MNLESTELNFSGTTYSVVDPSIYDTFNREGDAEIFETRLTQVILEKYCDDIEIRNYIQTLPKKDKRLALMSLIDKETKGDNNLLWSEMVAYVNSRTDKMDHVKDVIKIINKFVKDGAIEKKSFGEVMTPISLVREMLDTLPKEVWSNPNLKWLDPCNGAGTFPFVVIYKLMHGLTQIEDVEQRYKHIVENMIYTCELQSRNVFLWMCGVDPYDEYTTNTYWGSFLDEGFDKHMKEVWGVDKFDIVIGNPPYNSGQNASGKRGGGETLWDKFVIKILNNQLKNNGYLVFVHPTLWRKPQSERSSSKEVNEMMMKKQIHYLEMHDSADGMKVFNAGTRYDFYVLENCDIYTTTKINDEDRTITNVDLKGYNFIPNKGLEFFNKILAGPNDEKCKVIFNVSNYETRKEYVSDVNDDEHIYTLVHTTTKNGPRYKYSSRNDKGHFGIKKVIFGDSGINEPIIDINGDYGMTQHAMGIKVDSLDEANTIKNVLMSDDFSKFLESVMWSNFQIDWRLFTFLKKDFYNYF